MKPRRIVLLAPLIPTLLVVALVVAACAGEETTTTTQAVTATTQATTTTTETTTTTTAIGETTSATITGQPSARVGHMMVEDPTGSGLIMFGGAGASASLNDTWAYDPAANTWTELHPTGSLPSARWGHAVVCDPATGQVILFGGWDWSTGTVFNDTWAYDPATNTWTDLQPAGSLPPARSGPMVYDPVSGKVFMFGGCADAMDPSTYLNDTWVYDPAANTWTELHPTGDLPPARNGHMMVYEPDSMQVILFGGAGASASLNDTWAYDPAANTWTELQPGGSLPPARWAHAMVSDPPTGKVILFGGCADVMDPSSFLNDTWAYDPAANTWTELQPSSDLPTARNGHSMVYDPTGGKMILFAGQDGELNALDDTWTYDPAGNTWTTSLAATTATVAGLPVIYLAGPAYDPANGRVTFFGGWNGVAINGNTCAYNLATNTWTTLNPGGSKPTRRCGQVMEYDPASGRVIMWGGYEPTIDTWAYDPAANAWTNLHPAGDAPSARNGARMVYDPSSGRMILFGGRVGETECLGDTWAYDPEGNTWMELHPTGSLPSPRDAYSMVYDPTSARMVLFGGRSYDPVPETLYNDTWAYDPAANTWTELHPTGSLPSPRHASTVWDPSSGKIILFGGAVHPSINDTSTYDLVFDTWAYDPAANTWTELHPVGGIPSALGEMVYDASTSRVILFASMGKNPKPVNETWAYDPAANTWTELHPTVSVP
jgi:N-acetylneuraminic acid mutarotase